MMHCCYSRPAYACGHHVRRRDKDDSQCSTYHDLSPVWCSLGFFGSRGWIFCMSGQGVNRKKLQFSRLNYTWKCKKNGASEKRQCMTPPVKPVKYLLKMNLRDPMYQHIFYVGISMQQPNPACFTLNHNHNHLASYQATKILNQHTTSLSWNRGLQSH